MPKLTPDELQAARKSKADERRREEERRQREEEEEVARFQELERRRKEVFAKEHDLFERHETLKSFVGGIYDEVSKFSTKWPAHHVSTMMVDRANRAIRSARELLADEPDAYVEEINELVPAGDAVEAQDVTLTLRNVKDALGRMEDRHRDVRRNFRRP